MRNPVAKNDFNRAATHPDRSKRPPQTVDEGLLDYYAENACEVSQRAYDTDSVRLFIGEEEIYGFSDLDVEIKCPPLYEEDMKNRVLRVELVCTPTPGVLAELLDSFAKR